MCMHYHKFATAGDLTVINTLLVPYDQEVEGRRSQIGGYFVKETEHLFIIHISFPLSLSLWCQNHTHHTTSYLLHMAVHQF